MQGWGLRAPIKDSVAVRAQHLPSRISHLLRPSATDISHLSQVAANACLQAILLDYPGGQLQDEALQNAEDSGATEFALVLDLRQQGRDLPERLRLGGGRQRGDRHELIFRGELLGEHLFLADYNVADGDTMHFACRRRT